MELSDRATLLLRHGMQPVQVAAVLDIPLDQVAAFRRDRSAEIDEGGLWQPVTKNAGWQDSPLGSARPVEYKVLHGLVRFRGVLYRDPAAGAVIAPGDALVTMPNADAFPDKPRNILASILDMENIADPVNGVWRGILLNVAANGVIGLNAVLGGVFTGGRKSLVIFDGADYDIND